MKKYKIIKTTALFFAGLFLLSGCGENSSAKDSRETKATEEAQESSIQPASEPSADTADSGDFAARVPAPAAVGPGSGETFDYGTPEEGAMRAMTLADANGNLFYVDVNTGTPSLRSLRMRREIRSQRMP